ncbi:MULTISPECIES: S1C family serine protease [Salimicrobium]|nr:MULTISPECIES: serine protease [Salimicrobium]MBM7696866.1 S1-C subfamily serine protease [Salimicrobium jeotgali]SDX48320.1 Trypsin-like peptidase domain-containing protein [Salimicrobium album]SIS44245.1 Trypsin-like peptidase domain-containing protein [Salimicrobium salexigens]
MSWRDDEQMDEDLKENLNEEEMAELIEEENSFPRKERTEKRKNRNPFSKWLIILIAFFMFLSVISAIPRTFSIPAIDFLITSAKLYTDEDVRQYKESVVVVEAGEKKGTGFSYTSDGEILTNHHVIEGEKRISVSFEEEGLYSAEVVEEYEKIDLAVLKVSGKNLPHLELADRAQFQGDPPIRFIGNPLRFIRIANEGEIIGMKELEGWEEKVLVLDAPVYRGNSGSPVINEEGKVTGIVFATLQTDDHGKVGLAVPVDHFHEVNR